MLSKMSEIIQTMPECKIDATIKHHGVTIHLSNSNPEEETTDEAPNLLSLISEITQSMPDAKLDASIRSHGVTIEFSAYNSEDEKMNEAIKHENKRESKTHGSNHTTDDTQLQNIKTQPFEDENNDYEELVFWNGNEEYLLNNNYHSERKQNTYKFDRLDTQRYKQFKSRVGRLKMVKKSDDDMVSEDSSLWQSQANGKSLTDIRRI